MNEAHEIEQHAEVASAAKPAARTGVSSWFGGKATSVKRLCESITPFEVALEQFIEDAKAEKESWAIAARRLLESSKKELEAGNVECAWRCFFAAGRMELVGLHAHRRESFKAHGSAILREAAVKLKSWRKETVTDLISREGKFDPDADVNKVVEASRILHEHYENTYRKLANLRKQLAALALFSTIGLVAWIWISPELEIQPGENVTRVFWISVALLGMLGAGVSGLLSVASVGFAAKIPEQFANFIIALARLAVGAGAAVGVCVVLLAGVLNLGTGLTPALLYAVAFASGFTERLVVKAAESVSK